EVMAGFILDLVAPSKIESSLLLNRFDRPPRYVAQLGMGFHNGDFHVFPALVLGLPTPDRSHCRRGVALNHGEPKRTCGACCGSTGNMCQRRWVELNSNISAWEST